MKRQNDYENAFALWLDDSDLSYKRIKQSSRLKLPRTSVKSFDFIVNSGSNTYIVELKGRLFKGKTLENLSGLQNWTTRDDIISLCKWQTIEGISGAYIIFAYKIIDYLADIDGNDCIEYDGKIYAFLAIEAESYSEKMKTRSKKWDTVDLRGNDFRALAAKPSEIWVK